MKAHVPKNDNFDPKSKESLVRFYDSLTAEQKLMVTWTIGLVEEIESTDGAVEPSPDEARAYNEFADSLYAWQKDVLNVILRQAIERARKEKAEKTAVPRNEITD